jgi:hypothetical protein
MVLYGYDATENKIDSVKNKEQREFEYDKTNQLIEYQKKVRVSKNIFMIHWLTELG